MELGKLLIFITKENAASDFMRFKIIVAEGEDGWLVVECPSLPGCISQGKTQKEALENIKDAIQGCLDVLAERTKASEHEKVVEVVA